MRNFKKPKNSLNHKEYRSYLQDTLFQNKRELLSESIILEFLLNICYVNEDIRTISPRLLGHFSNLNNIITAEAEELCNILDFNEFLIFTFKLAKETSYRLSKNLISESSIIKKWSIFEDYLHITMGYLKTEKFRILFLSNELKIIADDLQDVGTINHTPIYIREIFKKASILGSFGIILCHNHPSGDNSPSHDDIILTNSIIRVGKLFNIKIHDHIIISYRGCFSFRKQGLIGINI